MANTKTWPDPDQHFTGQGRKDVTGVFLLSPATQKPVEPGGNTDGANATLGAQADTPATTDSGTFSYIALFKRLLGKLLVGQQTMANSLGVALASDQSNIPVSQKAATSGGSSEFHLISAATNNATSIKGSGGQVYGYEIYNTNAAVRYVKLYNKATAPAPASDNALLIRTIGVPPAGRAFYHTSNGLAGFVNGIGIAAVTGITDTDNTSVGASDLMIGIEYK